MSTSGSPLEIAVGNDDSQQQRRNPVEPLSLIDIRLVQKFISSSFEAIGKRVTMDTIRSMPVFFGIIGPSICFSPQAFGTPSKKLDKTTFEKVWSRLSLNFAYFLSNYVMIFFGVCVVVSLTYTDMIFYLALTSACWWFHLATKRNHIPITLFGKNLDDYISMHSRTKILWTFTGFVVMFYCLLPFFTMVSVSSVLVLTHALFRDPKHIDVASSSMFKYHDEDDDSDYEEDDNSGDSSRESEVLVESTDIMP